MTIWEKLFGSPEAAARTLNNMSLTPSDYCDMAYTISGNRETACPNCAYEPDYDEKVCEPKDMRYVDWLNQEVVE